MIKNLLIVTNDTANRKLSSIYIYIYIIIIIMYDTYIDILSILILMVSVSMIFDC